MDIIGLLVRVLNVDPAVAARVIANLLAWSTLVGTLLVVVAPPLRKVWPTSRLLAVLEAIGHALPGSHPAGAAEALRPSVPPAADGEPKP